MATPIDPKRMKLLDRFIQNSREKFGPRPRTFAESKWFKGEDPEWAFKQQSSMPANMEAFRRDGMSYKMIPSDRIYANQWYANPENQARAGYAQPVDPQVFKQEFVHRNGNITEMENEMTQRAYDKQVGRDVARKVAENRMVQRQFSPDNEYQLRVPSWAMPYLVNGDATGLSPAEISAVDNLVKSYGQQFNMVNEEPYFSRRNDLGGEEGSLGSDVYDVNFYPPIDKFGRRR